MHPFSIACLIIASLAVPCSAQLTLFPQEPNYIQMVVADGQPLLMNQRILTSTKTITLGGQLTRLSEQDYPQFESRLLIRKATLNLVRDTKRIGFISWPSENSLVTLFREAKPGDRFIIQVEDAALQLKQGGTQPIAKPKVYKLSVKE